ncbi:MAG TPA: cation-transporting P-type ATPase, partial [Cytophagales bacterium]
MATLPTLDHAHQMPLPELLQAVQADPAAGLTAQEARRRYDTYGPNALEETKRESWAAILLRQFTGVIVYILAAAAGISFFLGETVEGIAILVVLLINAVTGFILEWNARQSMDALRKMDTSRAKVLRDGRIREVPSDEITLGDVLVVEAGDLVPADGNLFDVNQLQV